MEQIAAESIITHFAETDDPREARGKRHLLLDILSIAILAVICDANDYQEIEGYGLAKKDWLSSFLALPHGIPSAATFRRVFAAVNPEAWQVCFTNWVRSLSLGSGSVATVATKGCQRGSVAQSHSEHFITVASVRMITLPILDTEETKSHLCCKDDFSQIIKSL